MRTGLGRIAKDQPDAFPVRLSIDHDRVTRMARKTGTKTEPSSEVIFGEVVQLDAIPTRGASRKYDVVMERAKELYAGEAVSFQAPSTSTLTRLKKRLVKAGYELTTRTNAGGEGVTAYVKRPASA
jgi:hypothetical protein